MDDQTAILLAMSDPIAAATGLSRKQQVACELTDIAAGVARTQWTAAYPFQDEEYRLAAEQAESYNANPAGGPFPALQADVDAGTIDPRTGEPVEDLEQAADLIMFTRGLYLTALESIRALRLTTKAAIKSAADEAAVRAAMAVSWPSPGAQ